MTVTSFLRRAVAAVAVTALAQGLTLAAGSASAAEVVPAAERAALVARLKAQADAWDRAIVRKDRAAIAANMAEDFRQIDGDADIEDKKNFLDGVLSDKLVIDPYTVEDFEVRLYGDTALLSGRTAMTGRWDGKPFKTHYRYIDIYAKQPDGQWKIVSVQITRVKPAP